MHVHQHYSIKKVEGNRSRSVIDFMMRIRKEIFPMLSQNTLPPDLLYFDQHYVQQKNAVVYAAYLEDGTVIGTIGIYPYDGRFTQLETYYQHIQTAEIVKCYIDPQYRRLGIGTILFDKALEFCRAAGYEKLYLHTHPFLPGAIPFWRAKGFEDRLAEDDPIWNTLHMDRGL